MNVKLLVSSMLFCAALLVAPANRAQAADAPQLPLCMPDTPQAVEPICQTLGPSAYIANQRMEGIPLPRTPLPAAALDPAYAELPYQYLRLVKDDVPIFSTLEDAMANQNPYRYIPAGFDFVTFVDYYQGSGDGKHYMIEPGMWIRGGSTNGRIYPPVFTGLVFAGTPQIKFGWVLYQTESQTAPGADNPVYTGHILNRYDSIQIYQTMEASGTLWLLIGPDEWIDTSKAALIYPASQPPQGVTNGRWIEINLYEQTLSVYQDNRLAFATLTSTGIPGWWTRPGLFQISEKLESTPMSGAFEADRSDYYYLEDVPWTMYFDQSRALHGAYWHNYFGYEQSHGCVNLSPGDAHWLYLWGSVGDFVYVWDPSGITPIDPTLYSAGGA